ncbi:MAG: hypothetical protein ACLP0J_06360 [Solirubrobacteraceae bacterium]
MSALALAALFASGCTARFAGRAPFSNVNGRALSEAPVLPGSVERSVPGAASLARLRSLPQQAQATVSATLGDGASAFAARRWREGWRVRGGGVAASLDRDGAVTVRASDGWLSMKPLGWGHGETPDGMRGAAALSARANRISFARGDLTEWLAAGPLGVEQGFLVTRRLEGRGGALDVTLALGGTLRARLAGQELRFYGSSGFVRYGGLLAVDAGGRRLAAMLVLRGRSLRIHVAARTARYPIRIDPIFANSVELLPTCTLNCAGYAAEEIGTGWFGYSVAISSNGTEALIGAPYDNRGAGGAWAFNLNSGGVWAVQAKLVADCVVACNYPGATGEGTEEVGQGHFGWSVALSADGTVALIGAPNDTQTVPPNTGTPQPEFPLTSGAAWVFTQSGGLWQQSGDKLVADCDQTDPTLATCIGPQGTGEYAQCPGDAPPPTDVAVCSAFGYSVSLSADGTVALIGAPLDSGGAGAAWVFTQSGGTWSQQAELTADCTSSCGGPSATGEIGAGQFGWSVSLSTAGDAALIGAPDDNSERGAAWVFTSSNGSWSQQTELLANCTGACSGSSAGDEIGRGLFGYSVSISGDAGTAAIGAPYDNGYAGAAWIFTGSGQAWSSQAKLLADCTSACGGPDASDEVGGGMFGFGVALSADGSAVAAGAAQDNSDEGAGWLFTRSGGNWSEQDKLVQDCTSNCGDDNGTGEFGDGELGVSVALSGSGTIAAVGAPQDGGPQDDAGTGAAWIAAATPGPTTPPVISGAPQLGQTLSCSTGSWTGNPTTFTYQWNSGASVIVGSTSPTYTIQSDDQGSTLTCSVFGVNVNGASAASTSAGLPVPSAVPVPTTPPWIIGAPQVGTTIECIAGAWTNTPFEFDYQWTRDGVTIQNATDTGYTIATVDEGSRLACSVIAEGLEANSSPAATPALFVPFESVAGCPGASGTVQGATFGRIILGMSRQRARDAYSHSTDTKHANEDSLCLRPLGINVGYPSTTLLKTLPKSERKRAMNTAIWITTANPLFTLDGIRAGEAIAALSPSLKIGKPVTVGKASTWYVFKLGSTSSALLLVSGGIVQEIGIADSRFTKTLNVERTLLSGIS